MCWASGDVAAAAAAVWVGATSIKARDENFSGPDDGSDDDGGDGRRAVKGRGAVWCRLDKSAANDPLPAFKVGATAVALGAIVVVVVLVAGAFETGRRARVPSPAKAVAARTDGADVLAVAGGCGWLTAEISAANVGGAVGTRKDKGGTEGGTAPAAATANGKVSPKDEISTPLTVKYDCAVCHAC